MFIIAVSVLIQVTHAQATFNINADMDEAEMQKQIDALVKKIKNVQNGQADEPEIPVQKDKPKKKKKEKAKGPRLSKKQEL